MPTADICMKPVIGITAGDLSSSASDASGHGRAHTELREEYLEAVATAGGRSVIVPTGPDTDVEATLAEIDGLILSGGADVDPGKYGEIALNATVQPDRGRDAKEFDILAAAEDADLPIFGICRGLQVLNVARGGTLIQDLPSQRPQGLRHRLVEPPLSPDHVVAIEPESRLRRIVAADALPANSRHHQAIARVGRRLRVAARTTDGLVEAVEGPSRRFVLAVQWHPEDLVDRPAHLALFEALVEAAAGHTATRRRT